MNHRMLIEVEVIRSDFLHAPTGFVKSKCPFCRHEVEIIMKGLEGNRNIVPTIKLGWEWHRKWWDRRIK